MKCKNCGGELIFQNGTGVCESCKNTYRLDYGFENTEVYICYTESDAQGRRTKDSIIAEKLYQKLESKKIHTFYERRSAPALIGDDLQAANYQAIYHAKIILIVGTSAVHFKHLLSKHNKDFGNKTVIPAYTDIRPEDLPPKLKRVQALNYNTIGADTDLLNGILRLLGREKEIKLEELHQRAGKRKKIVVIVLSLLLIIGIVAVAILLLFRESPMDKPESGSVLTSQEIYDNAQALMESGNYLGAAYLLASISDFRNSTNLLNEIYNRYDGYYLSEDKSVSFYINIQDAATANLILEKTINGQKVRTEESSVLVGHTITASFTDSENNTGEMTITLNNDDIHLITSIESESEPLSIGDLNLIFLLSQRSDRPLEQGVTSETLIQWMTNRTSLSDLNQAGYQLEYFKVSAGFGAAENSPWFSGYKIVNTDIKLLLSNVDWSRAKNVNDTQNNLLDDFYIVSVIAPAELACPQKLGDAAFVYKENNVVYALNVIDFIVYERYHFFFLFADDNIKDTTIGNDSMVGMTSQILAGRDFDNMAEDLLQIFLEESALSQFRNTYQPREDVYITPTIVQQKSDIVLIGIDYEQHVYYYRGNKDTGEVQFMADIPCDTSNSRLQWTEWRNYPELFGEFLTDSS